MLGRYSHVLFDLDGTIFNTEYAYTSALYDVLKAERPDTEETYQIYGLNRREYPY